MSKETTDILAARGSVYGPFIDNAACSQELKSVIQAHRKQRPLAPDIQEALDMIAFKISRILTGNPAYVDNWRDIAGYATLVANRLEKQ